MKLKKIIIAGAIGLLAVTASVGTSTEASAKSKVVTVKKASQVKKAKKKALKYYNGGTAYVVKGKSKYVKKVKSAVISDIKKKNNLKWVNTPTTSSKKSLKKYKSEVKYLSKIVEEVRQETGEHKSTYKGFYETVGMTDSQVNAIVLEMHGMTHVGYVDKNREWYVLGDYKKVYNKTFKGECGYTAKVFINIAKALGYKTRYFREVSKVRKHAFMCIEAVDTDGTKYWKGVAVNGAAGARTYSSKENTWGVSYKEKIPTAQEFYNKILNREIGTMSIMGYDTASITLKVGESITIPATYGCARILSDRTVKVEVVNGATVITAIAQTQDLSTPAKEIPALLCVDNRIMENGMTSKLTQFQLNINVE